jgi:ubiquinone/menaquinone biosynthesis C-methylase UbiE
MVQERDFRIVSYKRHESHFRDYARGGPKEDVGRSWLQENTVDAWRHNRMYQVLDPFLETHPQASWLTCGDGRYGKDAHYIQQKGLRVTASDISDVLLIEAKKAGYIKDFKKENAEALSFADRSFDYVFCKESLHHFPRPILSLYEMLRVSCKAVVIIEPIDRASISGFLDFLIRPIWTLLRSMIGRKPIRDRFEESGNYLYGITRREIEKVALGMNYKTVAFKGINDSYIKGVEFETIGAKGPLYRQIKRRIALCDLLSRLKIRDFTLLAAAIFKERPHPALRVALSNDGYRILDLPANPYQVTERTEDI